MPDRLVSNIRPLGFTWETRDPFLFCVHHLDNYPAGNDELGPAESLAGRPLGHDFTLKDGWRMYHGTRVPGFPMHPHRGFETVTIVLDGFVDHSDSHGAAGRYGNGDVQWMTAGAGMQHAEMFPLLNKNKANRLELFQIWLNLPKAKKFSAPHYAMLWAEDIPLHVKKDDTGKSTQIRVIAGQLADVSAPDPAPDSWASDPANQVGIWHIRMEANATWQLPPAGPGINRSLYFYQGSSLTIAGTELPHYHSAELSPAHPLQIENGQEGACLLLLQGRPINEAIAQHGPFVMNDMDEIHQAIADYQATRFGGWPWPDPDQVHPPERSRFARYADGREEIK